MTRLLVSARDLPEARSALRGGADIIDLKEPTLGSLGRCTPHVWREVARSMGTQVPLSAALGELQTFQMPRQPDDLRVFRYAKVGLSESARSRQWQKQWVAWHKTVSAYTQPVAVAYADDRVAGSPPPAEILSLAMDLGCRAYLIDTFAKTGGNVFSHLSGDALRSLFASARRHGMLTVLAGSLGELQFEQAIQAEPDVIAVRGAVCLGGRTGAVDASRVASCLSQVRQAAC